VSQIADAVPEKALLQADDDQSAIPIHMADMGTDNFEREFTLPLESTETVP
jgi:hypothetical protein